MQVTKSVTYMTQLKHNNGIDNLVAYVDNCIVKQITKFVT